MKQGIPPILIVFLILGCEKVVDVDLPTSKPKLVIDALIGINRKKNDAHITSGQVKLTLTAPFFQEEVPVAQNATVEIIDEDTGQSFSLIEDGPGTFGTGFPNLEFGKEYTLMVRYDGDVYTAKEKLNPSPIIDRVVQGDGFLFNEDKETEVMITFTDIPNERNYYLFSLGFDNFLVIDDEFFEDGQITFSYFYENIKPGDLLTITLFGIDKDFATYADLALVQSGDDAGGPFSVPPATIRGNIVNTTNADNFPFGYFALSEFNTQSLTVE